MSLFDIFWKKKDTVELARKKTDVIESESYTIPSHLTAKEFGKVNIFPKENDVEVQFTVLMEPQGKEAEGWQTGVALDCSASMKDWYGKLLSGKIPPDAESAYKRRGWVETSYNDGGSCMAFRQEAYDDAIKKGYLKFTENIVQPLAREFIAYLAGNLDADGGTTVIYWACGQGNSIEVLGDFTEEQCLNLNVEGPKDIPFGSKTMLTPAVKYFVDRFTDASRGMYIFITDGRVDDLKDVKKYTTQIAREISANKRNPVKCILIGVGTNIDEGQMEELDNLDTGTDVDIWDHKIAKEMRTLIEIFSEVVSENQIVASTGFLYDSKGNIMKKFTDGLPAKVSFTMPADSGFFELDVAGRRIRQNISRVNEKVEQ